MENIFLHLPGSSGGVTDAWDGILKHQLDINHKPCNFVELFPTTKRKIKLVFLSCCYVNTKRSNTKSKYIYYT